MMQYIYLTQLLDFTALLQELNLKLELYEDYSQNVESVLP